MSLLDSFQWAPGVGMLDTAKNTSFQAGAARDFAQTDLVNTENQAKQAELQDYISQSAKDLRENTRQAEIGKAKQDIANNEALSTYYKDNPNALSEQTAAKLHNEMLGYQKGISEKEHGIEQESVSKYYNPKTGEVNLDNYDQERTRQIQAGIHKEGDLPTVDELRNDPKALDVVKRSAAYSYYTQDQIAAQVAASTKSQAEMDKTRLEIQGRHQDTNAIIAGENKRAEDAQKAMTERWGLRAGSQERIAALKADKDQQVRDKAMFDKVVPDMSKYGDMKANVPYIVSGLMTFATTHNISADEGDLQGLASQTFPMAQSIYNQQAAQARQDMKDGKPYEIPKSVAEIATQLAQHIMVDPNQKAAVKKWLILNQNKISPSGELKETDVPEPQKAIQPSPPKAPRAVSTDPRDIVLPPNAQPKLGPEAFGEDAAGKARYEAYRTADKATQKKAEDYVAAQHEEFLAQLKKGP